MLPSALLVGRRAGGARCRAMAMAVAVAAQVGVVGGARADVSQVRLGIGIAA